MTVSQRLDSSMFAMTETKEATQLVLRRHWRPVDMLYQRRMALQARTDRLFVFSLRV